MRDLACCLVLFFACAYGLEDEGMTEHQVDQALVVSKAVQDMITQRTSYVDSVKAAAKAVVKTGASATAGCAAGAFIGSLLAPGTGTVVGCHGGALIASIFALYSEINTYYSEQMRRAIVAWRTYRRSLKHLKMVPGQDVKNKFRKCAVEVHEDKWPSQIDAEAQQSMKEMFADCQFAAQYIILMQKEYNHTFFLGEQKQFLEAFAGKWAMIFSGPGKAMSNEEIEEFLKTKNSRDEL